jgi:hypothetical protein
MTGPAPGSESGGTRRVGPAAADGTRRADPFGKRALFGLPPGLTDAPDPTDAPDTRGPTDGTVSDAVAAGPAVVIDPFSPAPRRRPVLFSADAGPADADPADADATKASASPSPRGFRRVIVAAVTCRSCGTRTRLDAIGLATRLLASVWVPGRHFSRYLRCPACEQRAWCRVSWGG